MVTPIYLSMKILVFVENDNCFDENILRWDYETDCGLSGKNND